MEYKIYIKTVLLQTGEKKDKYFIDYIGGLHDGRTEFYGLKLDEPQTEIRQGYTKHPESL